MKNKVVALQRIGWRARSDDFGVAKHRFELEPPLCKREIEAFEQAADISLPHGYRTFLERIGASGAGPFYGLDPLSRWDDGWVGDGPVPADFLRVPFAFRAAVGGDPLALVLQPHDTDYAFAGAMNIARQGCAYHTLLVISGPARGRVVNVNLDSNDAFFAAELTFLRWYERWCDELLDDLDMGWFGYREGGSDDQHLAVLGLPSSSVDARAGALVELGRRKRPDSRVRRALLRALAAPNAEPRRVAADGVRHVGTGAVVPLIGLLANDPDPNVRASAAITLGELRASVPSSPRALIEQALRSALNDASSDVSGRARFALERERPRQSRERLGWWHRLRDALGLGGR